MIYKKTMNTQLMIKLLERLIKDADCKIFLVLDNLHVHHSKILKAWVEEHKEQVTLFFLPSYSPELNPDEYLNCDIKAVVHSGVPARTKGKLKSQVLSLLRMRQKTPGRVMRYSQHPKIAYVV